LLNVTKSIGEHFINPQRDPQLAIIYITFQESWNSVKIAA